MDATSNVAGSASGPSLSSQLQSPQLEISEASGGGNLSHPSQPLRPLDKPPSSNPAHAISTPIETNTIPSPSSTNIMDPQSPAPKMTPDMHSLQRRRNSALLSQHQSLQLQQSPEQDTKLGERTAVTELSLNISSSSSASSGSSTAGASLTVVGAILEETERSPAAESPLAGFRHPAKTNHDWKNHYHKPKEDYEGVTLQLTKSLIKTYLKCNPSLNYKPQQNPRRVLTRPSKPTHNDGHDNEEWDYILYVNDILGAQEGQQYQILDILGQGTFGQVVKCVNVKTKEQVAVKVIKNKPAYYSQSLVEVAILDMLNRTWDKENKHNIVIMRDTFLFRNHLCIVFEILSVNLYELIKQNQFRGLSTNLVKVFVQQILECLVVLNKAKIIHCDLKPENILLKSLDSPLIKVIDFGSACHENQTVYTYIQSRFYRSPEVLVGLPYTSTIDMWSLGCIAAELFLGLPLFPGSSEYNQVSRIVEVCGIPHSYMCEKGKNAKNFFEKVGEGKGSWRLKSMDTYMKDTGLTEQPSKRYFKGTTLYEIITSYPMRKGLSQIDIDKELQNRISFMDFLKGLLNLNPLERWSPQQAKLHPFITGEPFTGPFVPPQRLALPKSLSVSQTPANSPAEYKQPLPNPSASNSSLKTSTSIKADEKDTSDAASIISVASTTSSYSRRPRANTISSSKVESVPANLFHLVAMQQQQQQHHQQLLSTQATPRYNSESAVTSRGNRRAGAPPITPIEQYRPPLDVQLDNDLAADHYGLRSPLDPFDMPRNVANVTMNTRGSLRRPNSNSVLRTDDSNLNSGTSAKHSPMLNRRGVGAIGISPNWGLSSSFSSTHPDSLPPQTAGVILDKRGFNSVHDMLFSSDRRPSVESLSDALLQIPLNPPQPSDPTPIPPANPAFPSALSKPPLGQVHYMPALNPPFPLRKAMSQNLRHSPGDPPSLSSTASQGQLLGTSSVMTSDVPPSPTHRGGPIALDPNSYGIPLELLASHTGTADFLASSDMSYQPFTDSHPRTGAKGERRSELVSRESSGTVNLDWDPFQPDMEGIQSTNGTTNLGGGGLILSQRRSSASLTSRRDSFSSMQHFTHMGYDLTGLVADSGNSNDSHNSSGRDQGSSMSSQTSSGGHTGTGMHSPRTNSNTTTTRQRAESMGEDAERSRMMDELTHEPSEPMYSFVHPRPFQRFDGGVGGGGRSGADGNLYTGEGRTDFGYDNRFFNPSANSGHIGNVPSPFSSGWRPHMQQQQQQQQQSQHVQQTHTISPYQPSLMRGQMTGMHSKRHSFSSLMGAEAMGLGSSLMAGFRFPQPYGSETNIRKSGDGSPNLTSVGVAGGCGLKSSPDGRMGAGAAAGMKQNEIPPSPSSQAGRVARRPPMPLMIPTHAGGGLGMGVHAYGVSPGSFGTLGAYGSMPSLITPNGELPPSIARNRGQHATPNSSMLTGYFGNTETSAHQDESQTQANG